MTDLKLKIMRFFRKHKKTIGIALFIWVLIIVVNYFLIFYKFPLEIKTTYKPNVPVMGGDSVPKALYDPIEELINEYITYCNNKDYESAYNMLSYSCKDELYPTIEKFSEYVNRIFSTKKIYNIQNYSNEKNLYIYRVRILDDILATGMTGKEKLDYYEEKFVIKKVGDNLELAIGEFVSNDTVDQVYEDEYMKISILDKNVLYDKEIYTVKIMSRSEFVTVLADFTNEYEIVLDLENDKRNFSYKDSTPIVIMPYETKEFKFEFVKYFDEGREAVRYYI